MKTILQTGLLAGLIAGTLDFTMATIVAYIRAGKGFAAVARFVASGALGKDAFRAGDWVVGAGLLFHYTIATSWALLYTVLYTQMAWVRQNMILSGISYAIGVGLIMNLVVVPLSLTPKGAFSFWKLVLDIAVLVVAIGLPIAYIIHKRLG